MGPAANNQKEGKKRTMFLINDITCGKKSGKGFFWDKGSEEMPGI